MSVANPTTLKCKIFAHSTSGCKSYTFQFSDSLVPQIKQYTPPATCAEWTLRVVRSGYTSEAGMGFNTYSELLCKLQPSNTVPIHTLCNPCRATAAPAYTQTACCTSRRPEGRAGVRSQLGIHLADYGPGWKQILLPTSRRSSCEHSLHPWKVHQRDSRS